MDSPGPRPRQSFARRMDDEAPPPHLRGVTISAAGERLLDHLAALGRKPTTISTYRSLFTTHLVPPLGDRLLDQTEPAHINQLMAGMARNGAGAKTRLNALTLAHQIFGYGQRNGWCRENPCESVDRPQVEEGTDIHYLEMEEVEALLRAVPSDHPLGPTDRALYLTATMTGLRQGELLALRWRDIDWAAGRVRVRRNFVRGHWGTPKSRRGSVPLADRTAGELERHYQRSAFQG